MLVSGAAGGVRVEVRGLVRGLAGRRGFFVIVVLTVVCELIICPIGIVTCMI